MFSSYSFSKFLLEPGLLGPSLRPDNFPVSARKHVPELRNQSSGEPPLLSRIPAPTSVRGRGSWLEEDDNYRGHLKNRTLGPVQDSDLPNFDKQQLHQNSHSCSSPGSTPIRLDSQTSEVKREEVFSDIV